METYWYNVSFDFDGIHYDGRITPEAKAGHAIPTSYHIVLNDVFFGYMHKDHDKWLVNEQRPAALVEALGKLIEQPGNEVQMMS